VRWVSSFGRFLTFTPHPHTEGTLVQAHHVGSGIPRSDAGHSGRGARLHTAAAHLRAPVVHRAVPGMRGPGPARDVLDHGDQHLQDRRRGQGLDQPDGLAALPVQLRLGGAGGIPDRHRLHGLPGRGAGLHGLLVEQAPQAWPEHDLQDRRSGTGLEYPCTAVHVHRPHGPGCDCDAPAAPALPVDLRLHGRVHRRPGRGPVH